MAAERARIYPERASFLTLALLLRPPRARRLLSMMPSPFSITRAAYATLAIVVITSACTTTTTTLTPDEPVDASAPTDPSDRDGATDRDPSKEAPPDEVDAGRTSDTKDAGDEAAPPGDAGADANVVCGPAGHVFTSENGPFCPFQADDVFDNCALGEHCCEYAEELGKPSVCRAGMTACDVEIATGFDWRCDERNDCPGGQVCCFAGAITPHALCADRYSASPDVHASACRPTACAAGETQMCGSQADCPLGTTCTGMRLRGKHFGFCKAETP